MKTIKTLAILCVLLLTCFVVACDNSSEEPTETQHEHAYSEWSVTKTPTCTTDGIKERDCSCGDIQTAAIPATGHAFSAWTTVAEATCSADGSKDRACSCGETETSVISTSGHKFSAWATTTEATCTVDGSKERTCSCGEKETEIIKASHSWEDATCVAAKECSKCHMTEGSALGHTTQFGTCDRCGNEITATIRCTHSLPSRYTSYFSYTGNYGSTTEIKSVSFDTSKNKITVTVNCQYMYTWGTNDARIAYYIKDPNGNIVENGNIHKYGCIETQLFTCTISFTPSMAGEYTITFYDFAY